MPLLVFAFDFDSIKKIKIVQEFKLCIQKYQIFLYVSLDVFDRKSMKKPTLRIGDFEIGRFMGFYDFLRRNPRTYWGNVASGFKAA